MTFVWEVALFLKKSLWDFGFQGSLQWKPTTERPCQRTTVELVSLDLFDSVVSSRTIWWATSIPRGYRQKKGPKKKRSHQQSEVSVSYIFSVFFGFQGVFQLCGVPPAASKSSLVQVGTLPDTWQIFQGWKWLFAHKFSSTPKNHDFFQPKNKNK